MSRRYLPTITNQLAAGRILYPWEDDGGGLNEAIPVRTLATMMDSGEEADTVLVAPISPIGPPPMIPGRAGYGQLERAILDWLDEYGEGQASEIGHDLRESAATVQSVRARVVTMWAEGKLIRVGRGRYRRAT